MGSEAKEREDLDLRAILQKSEAQTDFPDVPLDEFTPPTYAEWKAACEALLKGAPFDKKMYTKTYEGITFEPMYTRAGTEEILPKHSYPGMFDFLRGTRPNGYIEKPWGIAQACDETLPEETNELLLHEAEKGSTIYHLRLDTATLQNRDAKDASKVGDVGCSVTTTEDMHTVLNGLRLDRRPFYVYAGASALPMLALTAAAVRANGMDTKKLSGLIGADPLGELMANGTLYAPIATLYDEMAACARWAGKHAPQLCTVFVRSDALSRGGANDVQEVASALATGVAYIRAMMERGLTIDEAAQQIFFGFSMGANFFLQVAKLRAVRPIWAQIVRAFGGGEDAQRIRIHARPALFFKTVYDPYVNMLRNTTEIFSGVVGGIDSFENAPFDEPIRKGDEFSRRIARNVQIMLQEEFGLLQPIDPAGGSWAVESLTKEIGEKIWAEFQAIEGKGGMMQALKDGYIQSCVEKTLQERFKNLELRRDRIVGNNMYPNMAEKRLDPRPEDTKALRAKRNEEVQAYLADIDAPQKAACMTALRKAGAGEVAEAAIAAASSGATLAELRAALSDGTGEAECVAAIRPHRWSERYEALRMTTEAYRATHDGDNVRIFLANMGPIPQHKARADFSASFLQVGAFDVLTNEGFKETDEAAAAARDSHADAVVICSTDATYPDLVPELAPKLRAALPSATIYLAGAAPKDLEQAYREAGVDDFISVRANCYKILRFLQDKKGMIQ